MLHLERQRAEEEPRLSTGLPQSRDTGVTSGTGRAGGRAPGVWASAEFHSFSKRQEGRAASGAEARTVTRSELKVQRRSAGRGSGFGEHAACVAEGRSCEWWRHEQPPHLPHQ